MDASRDRDAAVLYTFKMVIRDLLLDVDSEKLDEFTKVKTNREKIELSVELGCLECFQDVSVPFREKSATLSTAARQRGNELFKTKKYQEALKSYNSGIILAPAAPGSDSSDGAASQSVELAFGFANRSAALYSLAIYDQSLTDIQHALTFGYPPNLQYKLFERKGKCFVALGKLTEARVALLKAQEMSGQASFEEKARAKWDATIMLLLEKCEPRPSGETGSDSAVTTGTPASRPPAQPCTTTSIEQTLPALTGEKSKVFPSASSVFGLQQTKTKGRYAVADQEAKAGEVLVVEKPYAAILYPERYMEYCQNCFKPASTPYPCLHCSSVLFCGEACQKEAWGSYHHLECKILGYLSKEWVGRLGHLALRIAVVTTWSKLRTFFTKSETEDEQSEQAASTLPSEFDEEGQYLDDYRSVHRLVTHPNGGGVEACFQLSTMAVFLATILAKTDFLRPRANDEESESSDATSESSDPEFITTLATTLLHLLQVVQCNAFAVTEMDSKHQDLKFSQPRDLGLALYSTASLLNHSCDPAVDLNFYGNVCLVRAMRNVKTGEEISADYGPLFLTMPKADRQETLLSQYFFSCDCVACTQNWPQWENLDTDNVMFLCGKCGRKLEGPTNSKKQSIKCKHCGKPQNVNNCLDLLARSHDKYIHAMEKAFRGDIESSLPAIQGHLTLMQRLLCQPWRDFFSCQATVKQCYRLLANRQPTS